MKLMEKIKQHKTKIVVASTSLFLPVVASIPAFAADSAPVFTPDTILDSALTTGLTSMTSLVTKMVPYVIGISLLGVGVGLVTSLIRRGGNSLRH